MNPEQQVTSFYWLKLPSETRLLLAKVFDLKKSQGAIVQHLNNKFEVMSDGYTDKDLKEITIEKMQKLLKDKTEKDFWKLFEATCQKVHENTSL